MSFMLAKFDPLDQNKLDPDIIYLYRRREKDESLPRGFYVNRTLLGTVSPDQPITGLFLGLSFSSPIIDPIYLKMTEEERVENGFLRKFDYNFNSNLAILITYVSICK